MIGFPHPYPGKAAESGYGILNTLDHQPVSTVKLLAVTEHFVSEDPGFHSHGDLGCTGGFCPIAHDAACNGKSIYNCMRDVTFIPAIQIGNPRPGTRTRADRTAVCRQLADTGLGMQGDKIGNQQRTIEFFLLHMQLPGINNNGKRYRQSLIPAAGADDNWLF